jgi:hypothetical protein
MVMIGWTCAGRAETGPKSMLMTGWTCATARKQAPKFRVMTGLRLRWSRAPFEQTTTSSRRHCPLL